MDDEHARRLQRNLTIGMITLQADMAGLEHLVDQPGITTELRRKLRDHLDRGAVVLAENRALHAALETEQTRMAYVMGRIS